MAKPHIHAESSAKRFGGVPEEYVDLHEFLDSSKSAIAGVRKFLEPFDDDDLYAMFGDHVTVTVNRDGSVETETCDHD